MSRVRILDVSPRVTLPMTSGSRIRIYHLLSTLAEHHEVRQFSQARLRDLRRPEFQAHAQNAPSYLEHRHATRFGSALSEVMERTRFGAPILTGYTLAASRPSLLREWADWADLILVEFPWQYGHCRRIAHGKPIVLATHNVQALKARSAGIHGPLARIWAAWTERLERGAARDADLLLAVSAEDGVEFSARYGVDPARIAVVPNGADTRRYRPADDTERATLRRARRLPATPLVIFPAPHRQAPIVEAMKWVRRVALRLPDVTFLITGAFNTPGVEGNVIFTGWVDDYASYLRSADCLVCPIALGGGTKIKMIEGAAAGLPIVAFAESVHGTTFRHGDHLLVVEKTTEAIAAGVRDMLNDRTVAARLGAAARRHAADHYDWRSSALVMEHALLDLQVASNRVAPHARDHSRARSSASKPSSSADSAAISSHNLG